MDILRRIFGKPKAKMPFAEVVNIVPGIDSIRCDVLFGQARNAVIAFNHFSETRPAGARLMIYAGPYWNDPEIGSPLALSLRYENGCEHCLVLNGISDTDLDDVRECVAINILEFAEDPANEAFCYPATIGLRSNR